MSTPTSGFAMEFIQDALQKMGEIDKDILWAKCDPILENFASGGKIESPSKFMLTMRDNFSGPGKVTSYIITIEETKT